MSDQEEVKQYLARRKVRRDRYKKEYGLDVPHIIWAFAKVRGEVHVFQFPKELRTTNKSVCGRVEIGNQKLIRGGVSDENVCRLIKSCCRKCKNTSVGDTRHD